MANDRDRFFEWPDARCKTVWEAHLADHAAFCAAEEASSVLLAARRERWLHELRWRLRAAVRLLPIDSSKLSQVLVEILESE